MPRALINLKGSGHQRWKAAFLGVVLILAVASGTAGAQGPRGNNFSPPAEQSDHYLRTPAAIADLTFTFGSHKGWVFSNVTFGIKDGRLIFASFLSQRPDGKVEFVDETAHMDAIVTDTTNLPAVFYQTKGSQRYEVKSFTLGRTATGEGYVDWTHVVSEDGTPEILALAAPSRNPQPESFDLCEVEHGIVCYGVCTGQCVVDGNDPCDCNALGFCFVDYEWWDCMLVNCDGECIWHDGSCGCFLPCPEPC